MRFCFAWPIALVSLLAIFPLRASDLSVEVVPEGSKTEGFTISLKVPFHVVLTNTGDHDLTLWKEWCSDGYFNLSFEFTSQDGKVIKVEKAGRDWAKNFPDGFVVKPGGHFVLPVTFSSNEPGAYQWTGIESLQGVMTLKAIYKNASDFIPNGNPIPKPWVGQVESKPMVVTIGDNVPHN